MTPYGDISFRSTLVQVMAWCLGADQVIAHYDVMKWKHCPRYWPFVRGIHRSPVNSPHKGQWRGALMISLICAWIKDWLNNGEAGDSRSYSAHYDVTVMWINVEYQFVRFICIHSRAISQRVCKLVSCIIRSKIILLKWMPHLPGAHELSIWIVVYWSSFR